jgi:hypothetical protein
MRLSAIAEHAKIMLNEVEAAESLNWSELLILTAQEPYVHSYYLEIYRTQHDDSPSKVVGNATQMFSCMHGTDLWLLFNDVVDSRKCQWR